MIIRKPIEADFEFQDATFTIRQLTPGQRLEIGDVATKKRIEFRMADENREAVRVIEPDQGAERIAVVNMAVTAWTDVLDADEKPIECDEAGKLFVLAGVEGFYAFVLEKLDELDKTAAEESRVIEKNS